MEVNSSCVDWEGVVPQCKLLFAAKPDEDRGAVVDMRLINVNLPQGTMEDDVCG